MKGLLISPGGGGSEAYVIWEILREAFIKSYII